jgi:multiple sugar transport system substrate-binding protein
MRANIATVRTRALLVLLSAAALSVTAACGSSVSGGGNTSAASSTFGVNATGTVTFWARSASKTLAEKLVTEFNATHKNLQVKLTLTSINDDVTSLATSIRAGDPPDLVGLNDIDVPTFTRNGSFMDLTSAISKLPFKSALSPGHMGLATYQGREYGVPMWADLSVLWYNKTLFRRAGLNPNDPPATFAQILTDAQKINALGHGISGISFAGDCQGCLGFTVQPGIWAAGQHLINGAIGSQTANITGNQPLIQSLQLYQKLWSQHLVPDADRTQDGTTWGQDFVKGTVGLLPGGYGQVQTIAPASLLPQIGDTPLPGPDGGYSTFDGGDDFVIPKAAKNPSGAWEFVTWALQQQQQEQYPDLGATPIRTDLLTPAFSAQFPLDAVALKALAHGYAPVTLVYDQVFNQASGPWFQMFTTAVYDDNMTQALQQGQSGITQLLQQANP